ncbi:DUF4142 domain-containing protein [Olivibacter sitiensis]|uniref:DUF4142 domain-containing protein n=1 Tax=Olivibacter sitiensis TaxID=376470 RepID=UPI0004863EC2|nr:DUF4142 domain-containing protein [Olivibacter sitiensis]
MKSKKRGFLSGALAVATLVSMNACTTVGDNKTPNNLYLTNATKADNEAYTFFRAVYQTASDEVAFAKQLDAKGSGEAKQVASKVSVQYQAILEKVAQLATDADVLIPQPGLAKFELAHGLDSAQADVLGEAYLKSSVKNQQKVIAQFKQVERNTSLPLRDYAQEVLPALEETLASIAPSEGHSSHH